MIYNILCYSIVYYTIVCMYVYILYTMLSARRARGVRLGRGEGEEDDGLVFVCPLHMH